MAETYKWCHSDCAVVKKQTPTDTEFCTKSKECTSNLKCVIQALKWVVSGKDTVTRGWKMTAPIM